MITKLGHDALEKHAGISRNLGKKFINLLKKTKPEYVKKPFVWAYKGVKKPTELAIKGMTNTGRFMYKHPHSTIPAVGLGLYGTAKFKDNVTKNYLHTDPQMQVTRRTATNEKVVPGLRSPRIDYANPRLKEYFKNRNMIY